MGAIYRGPRLRRKNRPTEPFGFFLFYIITHLSKSLRKWGLFFFSDIFIIKKIIMKKIIKITERDLSRIVKRVISEKYEDDYTFSGYDSMGDAAHSSMKSKGFSHRGKEESGEFFIMFDGEKFYEGDFEIADYNDTGDIPRVEGGKLIIANPAWGA